MVTFKPIPHLTSPRLLLPLLLSVLYQAGYVNGSPSGSWLGNRSKKAYLEEWIFTGDDSSDEQGFSKLPVLLQSTGTKGSYVMIILQHPDHRDSPILFPVNLVGPKVRLTFWERIEAPLPPLRPRCNFIHPRQLCPFPERLELAFSTDEILSGYEDIVSSGTDQFTALVKTDPHNTLVQMVDVQKATADFRQTSERRTATSSQTNRAGNHFSNRSVVQKRLSIYNCNPGPKRGKENAFEKQIAGR